MPAETPAQPPPPRQGQQFAALADELEKLRLLLNDPHPGLFTWCEMLNRRLDAVAALRAADAAPTTSPSMWFASDTAPPEEGIYLVALPFGVDVAFWDGSRWVDRAQGTPPLRNVSHWTNLPPHPTDDDAVLAASAAADAKAPTAQAGGAGGGK